MKISLNWLKNFIELNNSPEEISNLLTEVGLEVESIEKLGNKKLKLNDLVIGEIKKIKRWDLNLDLGFIAKEKTVIRFFIMTI